MSGSLLLELTLMASLLLPGLWIQTLVKLKTGSSLEKALLSYPLSLCVVFLLLFAGGHLGVFNLAVLLVLLLTVIACAHLTYLSLRNARKSGFGLAALYSALKPTYVMTLVASCGALIFVYSLFLCTRGILDSDVVQYYLPVAREIALTNRFTYTTGYDYSPFLRPIGGSVLYAFAYVLSGSLVSEAFRLMPLVPILVLVGACYRVAVLATGSHRIGFMATVVFLVLPFNDRFLLYNALYPDVFYYPLILLVMLFLLKYFESGDRSMLLWCSLLLGVAVLIKAQSVYFLISFPIVLTIFSWKNRFAAAAIAFCIPFLILLPNALLEWIQREGIKPSTLLSNLGQVSLFLVLGLATSIGCFAIVRRHVLMPSSNRHRTSGFFKNMACLSGPFTLFFSLWYLPNALRFGSLLYVSSLNPLNYGWAVELLRSIQPSSPSPPIGFFVLYFFTILLDPSVMGFVWFIPLIAGLVLAWRTDRRLLRILMLFEMFFVMLVLSQVAYSIPLTAYPTYNPRDIVPLAPLLAILVSSAFLRSRSVFWMDRMSEADSVFPLLLVAFFGLLSYIHSVLVRFASAGPVTAIGSLMSTFASAFGLDLYQSTFQLYAEQRILFYAQYMPNVIALGLVAGTPLIVKILIDRFEFSRRLKEASSRFTSRFHRLSYPRNRDLRLSNCRGFLRTLLILSIIPAVIIIPRGEVLAAFGGPSGFAEGELRLNYGAFYPFLVDDSISLQGDILTYKAPSGLPYYLPATRVIDLVYPANLAYLKNCFVNATPYDAALQLRSAGIVHLLINTKLTEPLDAALNGTLSSIVLNPELAFKMRSFGAWILYELGPFTFQ